MIDDKESSEQTEDIVIDGFRCAHATDKKTNDRMPDGIQWNEH